MDPIVEPKPLQNPSSDVRGRMRMLCRSDNARAVLLALGIAAFFALASHYAEYRGEHQTSVSDQTSVAGCDSDSCSQPVANATPATSNPEDTPVVGDDKYRQPAPDADMHRQPAPVSDTRRQAAHGAKSNMPGVVTSRKTGARARVGVAHAARFQAYIDDLENNHGARILFMGGIRPGHCSSSGMHPCGKALDVCQLRRGVVDSRCRLPPRRALAQIASSHGLFEGGRWCNSDYGHVQLGVSARDCGDQRTRIARRQIAPETRREVAVASFE